jgi:hypothetical protein
VVNSAAEPLGGLDALVIALRVAVTATDWLGETRRCHKLNGYRELDGIQSSGTLTRRTTSSTIMNPRFR